MAEQAKKGAKKMTGQVQQEAKNMAEQAKKGAKNIVRVTQKKGENLNKKFQLETKRLSSTPNKGGAAPAPQLPSSTRRSGKSQSRRRTKKKIKVPTKKHIVTSREEVVGQAGSEAKKKESNTSVGTEIYQSASKKQKTGDITSPDVSKIKPVFLKDLRISQNIQKELILAISKVLAASSQPVATADISSALDLGGASTFAEAKASLAETKSDPPAEQLETKPTLTPRGKRKRGGVPRRAKHNKSQNKKRSLKKHSYR